MKKRPNTIDPVRLRIDEIADNFELVWRKGQIPRIRDFVVAGPVDNESRLLIELIKVDLQCRVELGAGFPSFREIVDLYPELIDSPKDEFNSLINYWTSLQPATSARSEVETKTPAIESDSSSTPAFIGRFQVKRMIGAGSFGDVYLANDPAMDREVAIKIPHNRVFASAEERARFLTEAKAIGNLNHPNIICVHEVGYHEQVPFIVCDYVKGETLAELIEHHTMSYRESAQIILEVARAVDHAHSNKIIHRDIKPSNILMEENQVPFLTDFGMARIEQLNAALTQDGKILGTPCYMAPEQARGEESIDRRVDVYSLGAVLYELLSGQRPFGGNTQAVLHQVRNDDPKPLISLDDRIPQDLETICAKAMEKSRERRYERAADLAADLERFLENRPILARPVSRLGRMRKWAMRNRLSALLIVSIAVLMLMTTLVSTIVAAFYSNLAQNEIAANNRLEVQLSRTQLAGGVSKLEQGDSIGLLQLLKSTEMARNQPAEFKSRKMLTSFWNDYYSKYLHQVVGHDSAIMDLAMAEEFSLFATASNKGVIQVWDASTGKPVGAPFLHNEDQPIEIRRIFFSRDGEHLVSFGGDGKMVVGNWRSGKKYEKVLEYQCLPENSPFMKDDNYLVYAIDFKIYSLCLADLSTRLVADLGSTMKTYFVADSIGLLAVARTDGHISLINLNNRQIETIENAHTECIVTISVSPDGKFVASGSWDDTAKVWRLSDHQQVGMSIQHFEDVIGLSFSSDSNLLVTASFDSTIRLFDCENGEEVGQPMKHDGPVSTVCFSPDQTKLVSGGYDNQLRVWDVETQRLIEPRLNHQGKIVRAAYVPGFSQFVVSASADGTARVWNTDAGNEPEFDFVHPDRCWSVEYSKNQKLLTSSEDGTVFIWDTTLGKLADKLIGQGSPGTLVYANWLEGENRFVTSNLMQVRQWENQGDDWSLVETFDTGAPIRKVRRDPQGRFLFCSSDINAAFLIDFSAPVSTVLEIEHPDVVTDVAISPLGDRLATTCEDGVTRIFDAKTRAQIGSGLKQPRHCESLLFSPDGTTLVTASRDQSIRFWDVESQTADSRVINVRGRVLCMAFHPSGRILAIGTSSGEIRLYDVVSCQPCGGPLENNLWVEAITFSPDGKQLASASFDKSAKVWRIPRSLFDPELQKLRQDIWLTLGARFDENSTLTALPWKEWQRLREQIR